MSLLKPQELTNKVIELTKDISNVADIAEKNQRDISILDSELSSQKRFLNLIWGFLLAIVAVFLVTFVMLMIDAWRFHGQQTKENQQTIEELRTENIELKIKQTVILTIDSLNSLNSNFPSDTIKKKQ